jgi:HlyD family secretion protein
VKYNKHKKQHPIRMLILVSISMIMLSGCPSESAEEGASEGGPATPLPVVSAADEVVAEGEVVPANDVELRFERSGTVRETLVEEGSVVEIGDPLIRLDTRNLALDVEEAEADLANARASYDGLLAGATSEEISSTQALLRRAEASQMQAEASLGEVRGDVTSADIAAARADVEAARTDLVELEKGAKATEIQAARAKLDQAIIDMQETRDTLSANKTRSHADMESLANTLRDLQTNYSNIYWENRERAGDWESPNLDIEQKYKDQEEKALRAVQNAEYELERARIAYENAIQEEKTGIAEAEARVSEAEAAYNDVIDGSDIEDIAAARARLSDAQATLAKLQGEKRRANLAAAQASIEVAQAETERYRADLDRILSDPESYELDQSLSIIQQREVALKRARLELEKATLTSPINGQVVEINPTEGEWFTNNDTAVVVADTSGWEIETTDLDELEIVKVRVGSLARITFDALPNLELPGKVKSIQDIGKDYQGDIVYKVTIVPEQWDDRLRWKMTATVAIEPEDRATEEPEETETAPGMITPGASSGTTTPDATPATTPTNSTP